MGQQTKRDIPIQKHPMSNPNTQMFSQNTGSWLYHQPAIISRKPKWRTEIKRLNEISTECNEPKNKTKKKQKTKVSNKTAARASHSITKRLSRKNKCRNSSIKCFNQNTNREC